MSPLPKPQDVRVLGHHNGRIARQLYAERCNVREIAEYLHIEPYRVSVLLRWKAGRAPLVARKAA